eukprot:gnl/MRDRNA2_/MRDRNA2_16183_c0_seq1.p1 gnl/MRDRNA2_/MRDRNA2_16183_c0~~gnl/MRDRNA2_/MRDRNA2_16183_c0_seq1.p1  ORF type:complete len:444 (-),score=78.40 gnl/MRDRNA2_/MRDRNA2_16183_c0_seq1:46-1377(-)
MFRVCQTLCWILVTCCLSLGFCKERLISDLLFSKNIGRVFHPHWARDPAKIKKIRAALANGQAVLIRPALNETIAKALRAELLTVWENEKENQTQGINGAYREVYGRCHNVTEAEFMASRKEQNCTILNSQSKLPFVYHHHNSNGMDNFKLIQRLQGTWNKLGILSFADIMLQDAASPFFEEDGESSLLTDVEFKQILDDFLSAATIESDNATKQAAFVAALRKVPKLGIKSAHIAELRMLARNRLNMSSENMMHAQTEYAKEIFNTHASMSVFRPHAQSTSFTMTNYANNHGGGASNGGHGDFSFGHSDCNNGRLLSFNIHLASEEDWKEEWGGGFVWCYPYSYVPHRYNQMILFAPRAHSEHHVEMTFSAAPSHARRLSITGWFNAEAPPWYQMMYAVKEADKEGIEWLFQQFHREFQSKWCACSMPLTSKEEGVIEITET